MSASHCPFSTRVRERPLFIPRCTQTALQRQERHPRPETATSLPTSASPGSQDSRSPGRGPAAHASTAPRGAALPVTSSPRATDPASRPRPTALRFDVVTARLTPFGRSSSARGPSSGPTAGTRVLFVACLFRHVAGRLLSADSGTRSSKGPAGRTRAGLHAPGDKQEGSVPGVCRQLPNALLAGRPA